MTVPDKMEIPLRWQVPDYIITQYSNNVLVTHTDTEVIIMFFEALPPIRFSEREQPDEVVSECVARIAMHPEKAWSFLRALESNLEKHAARFGYSLTAEIMEEEDTDEHPGV
jgi:hypothetical protein